MKNIILLLLMFANLIYAAPSEHSPIGYWKTIDDVTQRPKAIVYISETQNKSLSGRIVKIFPHPGDSPHTLCTACKGDKHNQPILGMIFLYGHKKNKDVALQWASGKILDPRTGKIYHSTLTLASNGQQLRVRGYIGLPLFGRTQTWWRVASG
ncbi:MAG: hypothetical protein A3F42_04665 [Gammaproteobacteria bacterium RIFCSPHIGHO2_12_FULL_37_34]|nr:MAG: hypothetical protein A3F42_04665 [Gammaproteobacteria bacterium RIFCSPHIGHO2_12_FULL_37_34]